MQPAFDFGCIKTRNELVRSASRAIITTNVEIVLVNGRKGKSGQKAEYQMHELPTADDGARNMFPDDDNFQLGTAFLYTSEAYFLRLI